MNRHLNLPARAFVLRFCMDPKAELIDVRTYTEFAKGHIDGAKNIPSALREVWMALSKEKNYYLYWRVGGRSTAVAYEMARAGFNVVTLDDHMDELRAKMDDLIVSGAY